MQKQRILVIGSVRTEFIMELDSLPPAGGRTESEKSFCLPGGEGTETAVALSRLGADSLLCSKVGDDPDARDLKDYLVSEKIDTRFVSTLRGEDTALEVILREGEEEGRRILCAGAGACLDEEDIEESFISYPDAAVLHSDIPPRCAPAVFRLAAAQQIPLFVMSSGSQRFFNILPETECEIFSANEEEILTCTGITPSDQERCMKACMAFMQRIKAGHIVLRLGNRGYFLYDGTYYSFISAYDVPEIPGLQTDHAFSSALVLEYLRSGKDIKRACEYAAIVCAIYATKGGGLRAYPTDGEVRRFIKRNEIAFECGEVQE